MNIQDYNTIFYQIIKNYDLSDSNIFRKMLHSILVADNCFSIASSQYFNQQERSFAYLCGLLHDIGRMEQWNRFASFSDSKTKHHARIGAKLLKEKWIDKFELTKSQQEVLLEVVLYHSFPYPGKNTEVKKYLQVLRNADNYANLQNTASGLEKLWTKQNGVSADVLTKFQKRENLHGTLIKTKLDRVLQFLSRAYTIELPLLKKDLLARKYLNSIYDTYAPMLNIRDKKILYEECWRLKRELALQITAK